MNIRSHCIQSVVLKFIPDACELALAVSTYPAAITPSGLLPLITMGVVATILSLALYHSILIIIQYYVMCEKMRVMIITMLSFNDFLIQVSILEYYHSPML